MSGADGLDLRKKGNLEMPAQLTVRWGDEQAGVIVKFCHLVKPTALSEI